MTDRYSYSSLQAFKSCPLSYKLSRLDNLELRQEIGDGGDHHLRFGSAGHAGLEVYYSTIQEAQKQGVPIENVIGLVASMQAIFQEDYPTHLDPTDKAKTPENGLLMLEWYVKRWAAEDRNWKVLDCEGLDVGEFDSGLDAIRVDLVVENLEHGGIYGVDHKITSSANGRYLNAKWWSQFEPNSQVTGYIDYITQKYGRCDGFYINAIGMSWTDEKKSNGASNVFLFEVDDPQKPWRDFSHKEKRFIKGNKQREMIAAWGLQCRFERQMFNRTAGQIEQERESTEYWKGRIEEAVDSQWWGFNTSSCTFCQFKPMCSAGWTWPQDSEIVLGLYRQVCREVIMVKCSECDHGFDERLLNLGDRVLKEVGGNWAILVPACTKCRGLGVVPGARCVLDRDHSGSCSETLPEREEIEITVVEGDE
jgi:hypothetical protein